MRASTRAKQQSLLWLQQLLPGLVSLRHYQRRWLGPDLAAGLSVAAVALPVGIAYADLAGVPAVYGIYAAIFPLFAYTLFGSSRQLIIGPDAATCIMVAATLGPLAGGDPVRYQALVVLLTLFTGVVYLLSGIARLGFIANFLSFPILSGYLNGIGLLIMASQLQKLLGYPGEAEGFVGHLVLFSEAAALSHWPTLLLGLGLLIALIIFRRVFPLLPTALLLIVFSIVLVQVLDLQLAGVAVLGHVPAGAPPDFSWPVLSLDELKAVLRDAAGLALVSFTSGILTAKSFARRNHYAVDANRELLGFGMCNLASGLAQGFPVTGADSRTAINDAMGGKSQLVGVIAGCTMLLVLLFYTKPLAHVPVTALAAVIIVSAWGLLDFAAFKSLYKMSPREWLFSLGTTLGVLLLGALPGVLLAVGLSLLSILAISSRPPDAVLGRVPGLKEFHNIRDYPEAQTIPGILLYRFGAEVVFFNAEYFKARVLEAVAAESSPVQWVVLDASPVNMVDVTALQTVDELREELAEQGIVLAIARDRRNIGRTFDGKWFNVRRQLNSQYRFDTLESAVQAFQSQKTNG